MSDWDVDTLSLDAWVNDLETVVDAVGVDRFPILGISQGGPVAVAYAARHPERVSHLILYGAFALGGKKRAPAEKRNARSDDDFDAPWMGSG
jgi:pimeloyl-ACP methyl ester carboxylesterase